MFMLIPLLHLLLVQSNPKRKFQFVPYGDTAPSGYTTISCDGKVPGCTLELTHWTDNSTPKEFYADTSTEIALNFAKISSTDNNKKYDDYNNALILNNHFDTDGVLSTWTCLNPHKALKYTSLLIEGAEAGDFGEWSSDIGVKLEFTISSFLEDDEQNAYHKALEELPFILEDFVNTGGEGYKTRWEQEWNDVSEGWNTIENGSISITPIGNMVLIQGGTKVKNLPHYSIHRSLQSLDLLKKTTRILRAARGDGWSYSYEMPGHGWVKQLVKRNVIPEADGKLIVNKLNENGGGVNWFVGDGLTEICYSSDGISDCPETIMKHIKNVDKDA